MAGSSHVGVDLVVPWIIAAHARSTVRAPMEHHFDGPDYTLGIEEELMILDAEGLGLRNAMEDLLGETDAGEVKPELHESVLEIATKPCADLDEAAGQLRALRAEVRSRAEAHGLAIASSGTHPFSKWEDQRISGRERYRDLISDLRFVARQEIIFGLHVHVGLDDPETAVHVANGMRVHLPILLALSANSPFFRGEDTGLASSRTPVFRQFPRVGMPPAYDDWADYERRIGFMVDTGVIEDHTWLWYDVRIHPAFGTVEVRVCDAQTRVEHTLGLAALIQAMVKELAEHHRGGEELQRYPWEMLDENKWLAARSGLDGELIDLPTQERISARALAERLLERLRPYAEDLGSADALAALQDILDNGMGATRQRKVYETNKDFEELVRDLVEATAG
jgi:carboxylate-amine ligase